MSLGQFPTPANATYPSEPSGPQYLKLLRLPDDYASVVVKEMEAGNASYGATIVTGIKRWKFSYDGLSASDLSTLISHHDDANDKLLGFNFRDPRTNTLYTDVHYQDFSCDHTKTWSNSCELTLCKRPS